MPEEPKHIPVVKEVCIALSNDAFAFLINYIVEKTNHPFSADRDEAIEFLKNKPVFFIWGYINPKDGRKLINEILGINEGFFQRKVKVAKKADPSPVDFQTSLLKTLFRKLGYYTNEGEFLLSFGNYLDQLFYKNRLPGSVYRAQKQLIRSLRLDIERDEEIEPWESEIITDKDIEQRRQAMARYNYIRVLYIKNLIDFENTESEIPGTQWWFYFYGYDLVSKQQRERQSWPIIRLLLTFSFSEKSNNLIVSIKNTDSTNHYHYIGETDFKTSSAKVLVLNLRTVSSPKRRQLNIKLYMNGADGSFFLGQYLNYETETGRIISGVVALEMLKGEAPNDVYKPRVPNKYYIPFSKEDKDENSEIAHVIPFFEDLEKAFRSTESNTYEISGGKAIKK